MTIAKKTGIIDEDFTMIFGNMYCVLLFGARVCMYEIESDGLWAEREWGCTQLLFRGKMFYDLVIYCFLLIKQFDIDVLNIFRELFLDFSLL